MREGEVSAWCRGRAKMKHPPDATGAQRRDSRWIRRCEGEIPAGCPGCAKARHPEPQRDGLPGTGFRSLGCFRVRISAIHAPRAPSRVRFTAIGASRARVFGHWAASGFGFRPSTHPGFGICPSRGENRLWMDGSRTLVGQMDKTRTLVGQMDKIRTRISRRGCGHFLRQSYTAYPSASRCSSGVSQPSAWEMRPERNQRIPGHIPGSFSGHRRDSGASFVRRAASGFGFRPSTYPGFGFRPLGCFRVRISAIGASRVRHMSIQGRKSALDGRKPNPRWADGQNANPRWANGQNPNPKWIGAQPSLSGWTGCAPSLSGRTGCAPEIGGSRTLAERTAETRARTSQTNEI